MLKGVHIKKRLYNEVFQLLDIQSVLTARKKIPRICTIVPATLAVQTPSRGMVV